MAVERVLNRRPQKYDHRDLALSDYITPEMRRRAAAITQRDWPMPRILDQGDKPFCVGYAWAGFGISFPIFDDWNNDMGERIYWQAKIEDGEPGMENGSTTRSGVEAFRHFSALENDRYAFATSLDDIIVWALTTSPVITGTNWTYGMMQWDSDGLIHATGPNAGGHEWMISGVDTVARQFHCTNSWGLSFGVNGQFKIGFDDYLNLFNAEGDAVTTLEVTGTPLPPDPNPPAAPGCIPGTLIHLARLLGG